MIATEKEMERGYTFSLYSRTYFVPKRDNVGRKGTAKLVLHRLGYKTCKADIQRLMETLKECSCDYTNRNYFLLTGTDQKGMQFCELVPDDRESFVRMTV